MKNVNRREFIRLSSLAASGLYLSSLPIPAMANFDEDHFFIQIVIDGGWDPTYLFDARPLEMTKNQLLQNYNGVEPIPMKDKSGGSCLRSPITDPLMKFKNSFSVINGVVMAHSFDGHGQNMNHLFTANPFGGGSFLPLISKKGNFSKTSIDGIQAGSFFLQTNNHGEIVPLGGYDGERLVAAINKQPMIDLKQSKFDHIQSRFDANAQGQGKLSKANQALAGAMELQKDFYFKFKDIKFDNSGDIIEQNVELLRNVFSNKIARLGMLRIDPISEDPNEFFFIDTHGGAEAAKQPRMYQSIVDQISQYMDQLAQTPYDSKRSLLDVTTFMITSEFSRTMRQQILPFPKTGTDHNPLCNSIILGGKGIKGGQVVGQSDFQNSAEILSNAHLEKDKDKIKFMGAPYDFKAQELTKTSPAKFVVDDYINVHNVVNTVLTSFGVAKEHHWKVTNAGGPAPTLAKLLK